MVYQVDENRNIRLIAQSNRRVRLCEKITLVKTRLKYSYLDLLLNIAHVHLQIFCTQKNISI